MECSFTSYYCLNSLVWKSKFINKIGKISDFFSNINSRYLLKLVKTIQDDLDIFSTQLQLEFSFKGIYSLNSCFGI